MATAVIATGNPAADKKKLIAAVVLGLLALTMLYFAFFRGSSSTAVKVTVAPKPSVTPAGNKNSNFTIPTADEQNFEYTTQTINYVPGNAYAPDPGRNIFAFYEPPPPTPYSPTPVPPIIEKPPTPAPTPFYVLAFVNPQSVYAGQNGFRLEVNGDKFDPDSRIYFNQREFPTTFVNSQKMFIDISADQISEEGARQVIVQSLDGKRYSQQFMFTVQAPPRPTIAYIGMIGRKRYNNDTGYFMEPGKTIPFGARLNDIVSGRFKLIRLTPGEATFEDTSLGFRHRVPISQASASTGGSPGTQPGRPNTGDPSFPFQPPQPLDPNNCPPGIPCGNLKPYVPPQPANGRPDRTDKKDVDDNDDGDN